MESSPGDNPNSQQHPVSLNLTCGVCDAPAPDHLHFGAHCCYSCRAFFRRTVLRVRAKGLKRCKTGRQQCQVTSDAKSCIHCRYQKCLKIGMTPGLLQGKRRKKDDDNNGCDLDTDGPSQVGGADEDDLEGDNYALDMTSNSLSAKKKICQRPPSPELTTFKTESEKREPTPSSTIRTAVIQGTKPLTVPAPPRQSVIRFQSSSTPESPPVSSYPPPPPPLTDLVDMRNNYDTMLRIESDLLRQQGSVLFHTGNMLKQQADLIDMYVDGHIDNSVEGSSKKIKKCQDETSMFVQKCEDQTSMLIPKCEDQTSMLIPKCEDKTSMLIQKCEDETSMFVQKCLVEEEPLKEAPLFKSIFKLSDGKELEPSEVDDILSETKMKLNNFNEFGEIKFVTDRIKEETIDRKFEISEYKSTNPSFDDHDEWEINSTSTVFNNPYMNMTVEESYCLDKLVTDTKYHLKQCCPVSLWQARVGLYMGSLTHDDMLKIFTLSRKAQSFYHYKTMLSMPYFNELTTRCQNLIIMESMPACFSLNSAYYFFGHNGSTAIDQELETGLNTGLGDYILQYAPFAASMTPAKYEEYYRSPWATSTECELQHRKIFVEIGTSLQDLGYIGYLLLYALTLYNIDEEKLVSWGLGNSDLRTINMGQQRLDVLYSRFRKHKIGWKRSSYSYCNQKYMMDQLVHSKTIFTRENLQLKDDLSNSEGFHAIEHEKSSAS